MSDVTKKFDTEKIEGFFGKIKDLAGDAKDKLVDLYETAQAENEADGGSGLGDKIGDAFNTITFGGYDKIVQDVIKDNIDTKQLKSDMTKDEKTLILKEMYAAANSDVEKMVDEPEINLKNVDAEDDKSDSASERETIKLDESDESDDVEMDY